VFVPLAAMSAAPMIALSANRIVMGKHSQRRQTRRRARPDAVRSKARCRRFVDRWTLSRGGATLPSLTPKSRTDPNDALTLTLR
jgi:hypothetical protein